MKYGIEAVVREDIAKDTVTLYLVDHSLHFEATDPPEHWTVRVGHTKGHKARITALPLSEKATDVLQAWANAFNAKFLTVIPTPDANIDGLAIREVTE